MSDRNEQDIEILARIERIEVQNARLQQATAQISAYILQRTEVDVTTHERDYPLPDDADRLKRDHPEMYAAIIARHQAVTKEIAEANEHAKREQAARHDFDGRKMRIGERAQYGSFIILFGVVALIIALVVKEQYALAAGLGGALIGMFAYDRIDERRKAKEPEDPS